MSDRFERIGKNFFNHGVEVRKGNISGSITSTGSFASVQVADKVQGTLTVAGDTTFQNDVAVTGHITASGNISSSGTIYADNFTSTGGDSDGISFADDLDITGAITASGNLGAGGNLYITGTADIDGASNLASDLYVGGNITGSSNISASGNLYVTGNADIDGTLDVDGTANLDDVDIDGYVTASGNIGTDSKLFVTGTSNLVGNTTLQNDLSVSGNITGSTVSASTGKFTTIDIDGGAIDGAAIGASSHTTIKGTTIDATTDFTIGGTVITDGQVADDGTFTMDITDDMVIDVDGGNLDVKDGGTSLLNISSTVVSGSATSVATFGSYGGNVSGSVSSTGSFGYLNVDGDAVIGGNITFGDADTDNIIFGAEVSSSILPDADSTYDFGSSTKYWKDAYIDSVTATGNVSSSVSSTGSFGRVEIAGALTNNSDMFTTHLTGSFSGSFAGQIGSRKLHEESSAATTWTINHNLGSQYVNVTVYDSNDVMVIPTSVTANNANTMTLTFGSPVAGKAMLGLGGGSTADGRTHIHSESSAATNWRVTHSLGEQFPAVTVYDDNDEVILPATIKATGINYADLTFEEATSGNAHFSVGNGIPGITSANAGKFIKISSTGTNLEFTAANTDVTGALSITGSLSVEGHGHITASGNISASGTIYADNFQSAGGDSGGISFTDDLNLTGHLTASGNISSSGNLYVTGNTDIDGTLDVDGTSNLDDVDVDGYITASGNIGTDSKLFVTGTSNLVGDTTLQNDLLVSGHITASNNISASGNISTTGTLRADGNVDFNGDLDVDGTSNLDDVDVDGYITASGNIGTDSKLFVTGTSNLVGATTLQNSLTVAGNVSSSVSSTGSFGSVYSAGGLTVDGNIHGNDRLYLGTKMALDVNGSVIYLGSTTAADDNSAIYFRVDDANRMVVSSSGEVGIGLDKPTFHSGGGLHISNATAARLHLTDSDAGEASTDGMYVAQIGTESYVYNFENDALIFGTNTNERMRILAGGNVGIGTASNINDKLHVEGNMRVTGNLVAQEFHSEYISASVMYTSGSNKFGDTMDDKHQFTGSLQQSGSAAKHYLLTGNVGIGTMDPDSLLNISSSGREINMIGGSSGHQFEIIDGTGYTSATANVFIQDADNNDARATLQIKGNDGSAKSLFVASSGKVGIGTDEPTDLLHVYGTSGNVYGIIQATATNQAAGLYIIGHSGDESRLYFGDEGASNIGRVVYAHSDNSMQFTTNSSEAMRITSAGSVGIGTTAPSTTKFFVSGSTTNYLAQFLNTHATDGHGVSIRAGDDANVDTLILNQYDGTRTVTFRGDGNVGIGTTTMDGFLSINSGAQNAGLHVESTDSSANLSLADNAGSVVLAGASGNLIIETGGSASTAGSAASEKLRVSSSGAVGIGTTTPDALLHVHKGSAGSIAADAIPQLVIEEDDNTGIQLLTPDDKHSVIYFGSPSDATGATIDYRHSDDLMRIGTAQAGADLSILTGNGVELLKFTAEGQISGSSTSTGSFGNVFVPNSIQFGTRAFISNEQPAIRFNIGSNYNNVAFGNADAGDPWITIKTNEISGSSISTGSFGSVHTVGKVGIGTTAPYQRVTIQSPDSENSYIQFCTDNENGATSKGLLVGQQDGTSGDSYMWSQQEAADIIFGTKASGGSTATRMRILSSGYIEMGSAGGNENSIGHSSYNNPTQKLEINGDWGDPQHNVSGNVGDTNAIVRIAGGGHSNAIDMGVHSTSPYTAWIQGTNRGTSDGDAGTYGLSLNPKGGYVGIGTGFPTYPLHVSASVSGNWAAQVTNYHSSGWGLQIQAGDDVNDYALHCKDYDDANPLFWVRGNGKGYFKGGLGIGETGTINDGNIVVDEGIYVGANNGDNQIRVGQTGGGSTTLAIGNRSITVYDASDERKKDIIGNTSRGLSDVLKWSIKDFTWKSEWDRDSTTIQTGAIAQEIYKVNPELVNKHEIEDENGVIQDGVWGIEWIRTIPYMVKAIQELSEQNKVLEKRIKELEK